MKPSPVSLHEPVMEICRLLALPYNCTAQINIRPGEVKAVVYLERDGKKYVDPETNAPATETRAFRVTS